MIPQNYIFILSNLDKCNNNKDTKIGSLTSLLLSHLCITSEMIDSFSGYVKFSLNLALIKLIDLMGHNYNSINSAFNDGITKDTLGFSKSGIYEKFQSGKIKWHKLFCSIACHIALFIFKAKGCKIEDLYLVCDDTLIKRDKSTEKTELLSKVYDHNNMTYHKGYTLISLLLTNGKTSIPINFRLLASSNKDNIMGCDPMDESKKKYDGRTTVGKIIKAAKSKKRNCLIDMIKEVRANGIDSDYLLFDSWFFSKDLLETLKDMGICVIAMLKNNNTKFTTDDGRNRIISIKEISSDLNKKIKNGAKLPDIPVRYKVKIGSSSSKLKATIIMAKNWVKDTATKKPYIALLCTDLSLSNQDIVDAYSKRWTIECHYKDLKTIFKLESGCQATDFQTIVALTSLAHIRYIFLIAAKELFFPKDTYREVLNKFKIQALYGLIIQEMINYMSDTIDCFYKSCSEKFSKEELREIEKSMMSALQQSTNANKNYSIIQMLINMHKTLGFVIDFPEIEINQD